MTKYVIKRILLALLTCVIVLSIAYLLLCCLRIDRVMDPNPGMRLSKYMEYVSNGFLVRTSEETEIYGELLDKVTIEATGEIAYFYQAPVWTRFTTWAGNIITRWDWGTSIGVEDNVPAFTVLLNRLPVTIKLNIIAVLISVPLGIGFGVICALKKDSLFDNISQVVIIILIAIPSFVLVSYCILLAYNTDWLPPTWPVGEDVPLAQRVAGYIIPVFVLSIGSIAGYARFVRAELCEVLQSDYLLLARTKGLTKRQAIMRHAFRNAMVPVLPSVVSEFIAILGGSMILEKLYNINGVGRLYMDAFTRKDYSVLMVDMAFYTVIGLLASIVVDLSYGFIDPRIRMGAKK